jgi:tRNA(His) guanylyltransferase
MKDSIGDRMKDNYEDRYRIKLTRRVPVILRLDGRAFHTLTRRCERPFDPVFQNAMKHTAMHLCQEIMGAKCAYVQSDEISILITDFDKLTTEAWFDYNVQKIVSVAAGLAAVKFSGLFVDPYGSEYDACFDARAFNMPKEEVANYFVWRQKDWIRNSVSMLAQANFSHKQLQGKNQAAIHDMLHGIGINWADLEPKWKNGVFLIQSEDEGWKTLVEYEVTKDRQVIESLLLPKEE